MATLISESFVNALLPMIWNFYYEGFRQVEDTRAEIFNVERSSLDKERYQGISPIDDRPMEQYRNTGTIGHFQQYPSWETEIPNLEYAADLLITRRMLDDNQYTQLKQQARELGRSFAIRVQREAASVFNNAVSTGHLFSNSNKPLLADDHPAGPLDRSAANQWDNLGATGVTEMNIEAGRVAMMEFKDVNGNPNPAVPNILLVPPKGQSEARKIAESQFTINQAEGNAINPQWGQYRVITWPYLTNADSWFLIDGTLASNHLHWQVHSPMEILTFRDSQVATRLQFYARYGFGFSDPHFVYGFTA